MDRPTLCPCSRSRAWRVAALVVRAAAACAAVGPASAAHAQYFGRTKVQYTDFKFRVMHTPHYDIHFYPQEAEVTADAARVAERWYARHSATFGHTFTTKPLIFYANQADFQQTNVVGEQLTEETGGVTEATRDRVILPFTGVYAENDHVIGHELVHVFQYDIAERGRGGLGRMDQLPLWLVEGMAEYLSLGRDDPNTALWLRDAAVRNKIPTIRQLTSDPSFFPYRYGQALWAYVGGRWGDRAVTDIFRAALDVGLDRAFQRYTGMSTAALSKEWIAAIKADYLPLTVGRTPPGRAGDRIVTQGRRGGDLNVSPVVSADGRLVAFFSSRDLLGINLFVADARTGRVIRELSAPSTSPHLDAVSFIYSAGAWSPDARRLATIVYAQGRNELVLVNVRSGSIERRIRVPGVTAITTVAWSPDGRTLALSGGAGGVSDLYLYDLATGRTDQLTSDRYADLQPAWSPDGRTLAFATDRGAGTDFAQLRYAQLQLALVDVATRQIRLLPVFPGAKHINPQFSPDGRDLVFVSDQDGFDDVYRYTIASGQVSRVTRVATGVSGITATSPAISVAARTGRLVFSVFESQGYTLYALDSAATAGTPVPTTAVAPVDNPGATTPSSAAPAGLLPPVSTGNTGLVASYLADPLQGLPPPQQYPVTPYRARLQLEAIGSPGVGVATGGIGGTQFVGSVAGQFADMLENHVLQAAVQVSGTVQDLGGQVLYLNQQRRWNLLASAAHIPYLTGFAYVEPVTIPTGGGGTVQGVQASQVLQRIFVDQAGVGAQYPFSTTRRFETGVSLNHYGFSTQIERAVLFGDQVLSDRLIDTSSPPGITFGQLSAAFVGDNSFFGFTSPIAGSRFRVEATPTVGQLRFVGALADYRRYVFVRPFTLAFRGVHYGRYGSNALVDTLSPLYVGDPLLVRGYEAEQVDASECAGTVVSFSSGCPALDRLIGSRIAVVNAEVRIPLFGTSRLGLFDVPFLPVEVAPFVDAGVAWTASERPTLHFGRSGSARAPVSSAGVSARFNLFGFAVMELYEAYPFQRPGVGWQFGVQFLPGW